MLLAVGLGWGSMNIGDPVKDNWVGVGVFKRISFVTAENKNKPFWNFNFIQKAFGKSVENFFGTIRYSIPKYDSGIHLNTITILL